MTEEQFLSIFKTSVDFIHDYNNLLECDKKIANYNRSTALSFLSTMVKEYQKEINIFGNIFDGIHTVDNIYLSDYEILDQLKYLSTHIPIYSLIKKGEEELVKKIYKWIIKK